MPVLFGIMACVGVLFSIAAILYWLAMPFLFIFSDVGGWRIIGAGIGMVFVFAFGILIFAVGMHFLDELEHQERREGKKPNGGGGIDEDVGNEGEEESNVVSFKK